MKKLLGIVVLGLLVCNITFAKTINIDDKILLNVPENFNYIETRNYFMNKEIYDIKDIEMNKPNTSEFRKSHKPPCVAFVWQPTNRSTRKSTTKNQTTKDYFGHQHR